MRESLTIFACFLIAVLTAALIGPCLVDWTAQRAFVEAQLTRTLGARVTTHGPIGLVLLPTPRLDLGGLDIVPALGGSLHSGAVRLELAVMPLLRGEFRFMEASIDQPEVRLSLSADGSLPGHAPNDSQQDVRFERIELHGGRFTLDDPGGASPSQVSTCGRKPAPSPGRFVARAPSPWAIPASGFTFPPARAMASGCGSNG